MAVDACFSNFGAMGLGNNDEMAIVGELGGVRFASLSKLSLCNYYQLIQKEIIYKVWRT